MSYDLWGRLTYVLSPQFDIYEQIAGVVNGKVADIGCGTGFGTHLLTRSAQYVRGFDIDEKAISFAKRCFENHAINFEVGSVGDAAERYEGRYDFVVMVDVIEHIREDSLAIQCCKKLLRKDGTLICSTPNRLSRYRKSKYHIREYSPADLKGLLSRVFLISDILDFQMQPIESGYENPIIGMCQCA